MIHISPLAYQKIVTAQGFKTWEVGFYGITDDDDITRIHDVFMPEQECHDSRNEFNEMSVSNYAASYLKKNYSMRQLLSVWIHTHPGKGKPAPSKDDREMFDRMMEQCGNVGLMMIASENDMVGWLRVKPIKGLKRTLESVEEVTIDWTMDTVSVFRYEKWKKRHDTVVTLLPVAYVAPTGSSNYRKCPRCSSWKPQVGEARCSMSTCYTTIGTVCQECRDVMGNRCMPCYTEHLCGKNKDAIALDGPVEVTTCNGVCAKCKLEECSIRLEDYAPSEYCDTKCVDCYETFCYDRDDIPSTMNCGGTCGYCLDADACEFALSEVIEEAEAEAEYQLELREEGTGHEDNY